MNLTPKETAERLRLHIGTLSAWRTRGTGPRYIKLGRKVMYPVKEIEAYLKQQTRESTSQVTV